MPVRRGTTNKNVNGNSTDRRRRREWLVATYRANVDVSPVVEMAAGLAIDVEPWQVDFIILPLGEGLAACRCYRCGCLLTTATVTVDRIVPGCLGGTYRRNNIRPACGPCNSETGGALRSSGRAS